MLKLWRVTKVKVLFLVLVYVFILTYLNFWPPFWGRVYGITMYHTHYILLIAMFLVTSPIAINVPTTGLLGVETMHAIVQWL